MSNRDEMREFENSYEKRMGYRPNKTITGAYFDPDVAREWHGWQDAISSLPRMTEEEITDLCHQTISQNDYVNFPEVFEKESNDIARALIAKLPHIIEESNHG